jgi:hypothetical protein
MNDIFMSHGQYGELDKLNEDGSSCQLWKVSGGLTNSGQSRDRYAKSANRSTELKGESWMMLTWDKTFIHVTHKELPMAFVVSPEMAMDFAQPCRRLSDTQWCALAHRLAKVTSPSKELTARILDQVARLNPEKLRDATFRKHLLDFRDQAMQTMPTDNDAKFHAWVEGQTKTFLKTHEVQKVEQGSLSTNQ